MASKLVRKILGTGLLVGTLATVNACKTTSEGDAFINFMGYAAGETFVRESIKKEMGHSDYYRTNEEEAREKLEQEQMITPKYESGDVYTPDGKTIWTRREDGLWESILSDGKKYTVTDRQVMGFSKKSGVPIVRPDSDLIFRKKAEGGIIIKKPDGSWVVLNQIGTSIKTLNLNEDDANEFAKKYNLKID